MSQLNYQYLAMQCEYDLKIISACTVKFNNATLPKHVTNMTIVNGLYHIDPYMFENV